MTSRVHSNRPLVPTKILPVNPLVAALRPLEKRFVSVGESVGDSQTVSPISAISSSPINQSLIAAGSRSGLISLYVTGSVIMPRYNVSVTSRHAVNSVSFLEEHVLASAGEDGCVNLWDCTCVSSGISKVLSLQTRESITAMIAVRNFGDSSIILTGTKSGVLQIRDLRTRSGDGDKSCKSSLNSITTLSEGSNGIFVFGTSSGEIASQDIRCMRQDPIVRFTNVRPIVNTKEFFSQVTSLPDENVWAIALGKTKKLPAIKRDTQSNIVVAPTNSLNGFAHNGAILALGFQTPLLLATLGTDKKIKLFDCITGSFLNETTVLSRTPICGSFSPTFGLVVGDRRSVQFCGSHNLSDMNTHRGSVTAICPVGYWGICSGGGDGHIFHTAFN